VRRGRLNEPRNTAIYLVRKLRCDALGQIANMFQVANASTVSSVVERMAKRLKSDPELRKRLLNMEMAVKKRQEQA